MCSFVPLDRFREQTYPNSSAIYQCAVVLVYVRKSSIHEILYFYWNEHGGFHRGGL